MNNTTHTTKTDHAPQINYIEDHETSYYSDPDAAHDVRNAAVDFHAHVDHLLADLDGIDLANPTHRNAVRSYFKDILAALDGVESYDDETIRLTLTPQ